MLVSLYYWL